MNRRWSALCAAVIAVQTFLLLVRTEMGVGFAFPARPGPEPAAAAGEPLPAEETSPAPAGTASPTPESTPFPAAETLLENRTGFTPDLEALASEPLKLRLPKEGVQILIVHTHGTEAYTPVAGEEYAASDPYHTTDPTKSVIRVGDVLQQTLESYGLTVLHDRTLYDYPGYNGAYDRSASAVSRALAEHPEIAVVIDVHRDAPGNPDAAYKNISHREGEAARVMLVIGTGENGLAHPNWQENLALALALQLAASESCPGLTRPIHLARERYNQQLSPGAFILEVGSNGNTLSEAERAAEAFGRIAAPLFCSLREG